jgi:hypothetical protein
MLKPVIYWCAAAVLAVGVVLMHGFSGSWGPWLFPELQTPITGPIQLGPWTKWLMMAYLGLSVAGGAGVALLAGAAGIRAGPAALGGGAGGPAMSRGAEDR